MKEKKNKGFVYLMSYTKNPSITKIGKTKKHPEIRANGLSKNTAVYGEYNPIWSKEVDDITFFEKYLHYIFRDYFEEKEFFKVKPKDAIEIAESAMDNFQKMIKPMQLSGILNPKEILTKRINAFKICLKYTKDNKKKTFISKRIKELENEIENSY